MSLLFLVIRVSFFFRLPLRIIYIYICRCINIKKTKKKKTTHHPKQISNPPPNAHPFTAAITGFFPTRRLTPINPEGGCINNILPSPFPFPFPSFSLLLLISSCSIKSCPAQNAFSPAPVITATRRIGESSNQVRIASASQCAAEGRLFICCGRLMVMRRMLGEG